MKFHPFAFIFIKSLNIDIEVFRMSPRAKLIIDNATKAAAFKKMVAEKQPMLVLYHAHWCPHCVNFVGANHEDSYPWQQICKKVGNQIVCVEVESSHMPLMGSEYNQVQGFPTLMYMRGGTYKAEFSGNRGNPADVAEFIAEHNKASVGGGCGCRGISGGAKKKPAGAKKPAGVKPAGVKPAAAQAKKKSK
jgi:thiol-disulfide isomerase/thioredoxin